MFYLFSHSGARLIFIELTERWTDRGRRKAQPWVRKTTGRNSPRREVAKTYKRTKLNEREREKGRAGSQRKKDRAPKRVQHTHMQQPQRQRDPGDVNDPDGFG